MAELRIYCLHLIVISIYWLSRHHTAVLWELRQEKTNTARNPQSRGEQWRKEHAGPSSSSRGPTQVQQSHLHEIQHRPKVWITL